MLCYGFVWIQVRNRPQFTTLPKFQGPIFFNIKGMWWNDDWHLIVLMAENELMDVLHVTDIQDSFIFSRNCVIKTIWYGWTTITSGGNNHFILETAGRFINRNFFIEQFIGHDFILVLQIQILFLPAVVENILFHVLDRSGKGHACQVWICSLMTSVWMSRSSQLLSVAL